MQHFPILHARNVSALVDFNSFFESHIPTRLKCISMSFGCSGRTCNNSDLNDDVIWVQSFPILHAWNVAVLVDLNCFSESRIHTKSFTSLPWGDSHRNNTHFWIQIYVKTLWSWQSSHGIVVMGWDSEQLMRSIETSTFYFNACNYHLIDVATLIDTRSGHMVFLTKLND